MLEVRDLSVVYPNGTEALKSVSFRAEGSSIIAIIGRSGAGKSTLLRCINGIQKVTTGTITLDNEEITQYTERQWRILRRHIGFVWQEFNLVERLTAFRNVLTGRLAYNPGLPSLLGFFGANDRQIALDSLERVNMLHRAGHRADRLSGGEKQRVSIARAVAQQPRIILADEPVASLDPELSVQIMNDLARVARDVGAITLINIHQVELAKQFSDRLIGIASGVVVFDGRPADLTDAMLDRIYRFDNDTTNQAKGPSAAPAPALAY